MWLVLGMASDEVAAWAHAALGRLGLRPLELITDRDLRAAGWDHRVASDGARTILTLADGRVIDSRQVRGALNRFVALPPHLLDGVAESDREYAAAELSALLVSWLAAVGGTVLNPASTRGLCGAWRPPTEWAVLAAAAGLETAAVTIEAGSLDGEGGPPAAGWLDWPPLAPLPEDVIVVGQAVFARRALRTPVRRACRRLAALSGTPILGLRFEGGSDGGRHILAGVTPIPNLLAGGDALIADLARAMTGPAAAP